MPDEHPAANRRRWFSNVGSVGPADWTPEWVTYSRVFDNSIALWLWRRTFCRGGIHLFDQVVSGGDRRLYCDACGCEVRLV